MATAKRIFATVGTILAVYLAMAIFFFLFSIGNPYSDGDSFLRGIINSPWLIQLLGSILIAFAAIYIAVNKVKVAEKMKNGFWKFFSK